jgi:hypothetical protein
MIRFLSEKPKSMIEKPFLADFLWGGEVAEIQYLPSYWVCCLDFICNDQIFEREALFGRLSLVEIAEIQYLPSYWVCCLNFLAMIKLLSEKPKSMIEKPFLADFLWWRWLKLISAQLLGLLP